MPICRTMGFKLTPGFGEGVADAPLSLGAGEYARAASSDFQSCRQERGRDQRQAAAQVGKRLGSGAKLAHDQDGPALGEDLGGLGDGAELSVTGHAMKNNGDAA